MRTSASPAITAGRASGSPTRRNTDHGPRPRIRAASSARPERPSNSDRVSRKTYGYSTTPKISASTSMRITFQYMNVSGPAPVSQRTTRCTGPVTSSIPA
jgi:hypothetical protein